MKELPDLLASVAQNVRRAQWRRGLFATSASVLGGIFIVMMLDYAIPGLSKVMRALLSGSVCVIGFVTAWKFLIVPLRRPLDSKGLARRIEIENPALEESVSTALWVGDRSPGSLGEVVDQMATGGLVSGKEKVSALVPTRRAGQLTAGLLGILVLALVFAPGAISVLFRRAVFPLSNVANAQAEKLVVSPGDVVMTRGDALEIVATGERGDAFFESGSTPVAMEKMGEGSARLILNEVNASFDYRVVVGAAESEVFQVKVVAPPQADVFRVRVILPEYLGGEFVAENPAEIEAVVGSRLVPELKLPEGVSASGAGEQALSEIGEKQWSVTLKNSLGVTSEISPLRVMVVEDRLPEIKWIWPLKRELNSLPDVMLNLDVESVDDFKIKKLAFYAEYDGAEELIKVPLDLAHFASRGIVELSVTARAWDACPRAGGDQPHYGESSPVKILIGNGSADPEMLALRERVKKAMRETREAARDLDQARAKLAHNAQRFDREKITKEDMVARSKTALEDVARAEEALRNVEKLTASLPLAGALDQAREKVSETARGAAEAPLQSSSDARADASRAAAQSAAEAKEQVAALEKAIKEAGERAEQVMEIEKLARRQERRVGEVATLAEGKPGAWEKGREMWARNQQKDAEALARLEVKMARQKSNSDPAATEALGKAASEAREASTNQEAENALDAARRAAASLAMATKAGQGESGEGGSEKGNEGALAVQPTSGSESTRLPDSGVSPPKENLLSGGAAKGELGAGAKDGVPPGFGAAVRAYFNSLSDD